MPYGKHTQESALNKVVTLNTLRKMKAAKEKFVTVALYDAPMAAMAKKSGVQVLLVGDSLGMTVLGYDSTIPVTMEQMIYHVEAVKRGNDKSLIMGDMPFMSYATPELAMQNIKVIRDIFPQTKATAVISGVNIDRQKDQLKKRPQIISATPGRLRDFIVRGLIKPQDFDILVIDEIDALLREGIENLVADLLQNMPVENHQCIVASATVTNKTEELLTYWRPEFFLIENKETASTKHSYVFTNPNRRDICLMKLIRKEKIKRDFARALCDCAKA